MKKLLLFILCAANFSVRAQQTDTYVKDNFTKIDTLISMRDGTRLYTVIYIPKAIPGKYPILLHRTPYSAGPYGDTSFPRRVGPNVSLMKSGYIFVNQDVRGRYMSEGINLEVTPHNPNKKNKKDVDESSDTYDTIEWLLKNIKNNNGRVGIYGISYPGFYATASLPEAHPALKAVSPQAPVTDEFEGDDVNHNGAFFLMDNFNFMNYYGIPRTGPVKDYESYIFNYATKDAYQFFLKMGPLKNTQSEKYFNHRSFVWDEYLLHDTYDDYWKARNIRNHLSHVTVPTLVVGGWFDAEDLFGALKTYEAIEKKNSSNKNMLVMGPWTHGSWAATEWKSYASHDFGSNTSKYFQDSIEKVFFDYYLKDSGTFNIAEATIFETGSNKWTTYAQWPPANAKPVVYYLAENNTLTTAARSRETYFDEYTSDPKKPVPYTGGIYGYRNNDYMAEDQRFAATRTDVLVYETPELTEDLTVTGSIPVELQVSITGSDADFVVKLIDVLPPTEPNFRNAPKGFQMAGYQRMVRADVIRGKFRNSLENPMPFEPNVQTTVAFRLNDIAHTFKKGHKIMVQVQSSWFPLVDRNPQRFMTIRDAEEKDFQKATIRIFHNSKITLPVLTVK